MRRAVYGLLLLLTFVSTAQAQTRCEHGGTASNTNTCANDAFLIGTGSEVDEDVPVGTCAGAPLSFDNTQADGDRLECIDQIQWDGTNIDMTPVVGDDVVANEVVAEVRNETGATLFKCTPVYLTGTIHASGVPQVDVADADLNMPAFGLIREDLATATTGFVVVAGEMRDADTATTQDGGWSGGDELYVDASPTKASADCGEALTNVKPTGATSLIQKVAVVTRVDGTNGTVEVFGAGRSNDLPNIASTNFWVGNGSGVATAVAMSSDATMDNTGAVTIADGAVLLNEIGDAGGNGTVLVAENVQSWQWDSGVAAVSLDAMSFEYTNDASVTDSAVQRILVVTARDSGNDAVGNTENLIGLENLDSNDAVLVGIDFSDTTGAITTAIDANSAQITNIIAHQGGNVTTTDLDIIDDGEINNADMADATLNAGKIDDTNVPSAGECLTAATASATTQFTWAACGGGGMTSFDIDGDNNSPQTVSDAQEALFVGGNGIITTAGVTRQVTFDLDLNGTADGVGAAVNLSGLEFTATNELALLQGCADGEVLKWIDGTSQWDCAADSTGSGVWQDTAGVVNLVTAGNSVTIGSATSDGKLFVDGDTGAEYGIHVRSATVADPVETLRIHHRTTGVNDAAMVIVGNEKTGADGDFSRTEWQMNDNAGTEVPVMTWFAQTAESDTGAVDGAFVLQLRLDGAMQTVFEGNMTTTVGGPYWRINGQNLDINFDVRDDLGNNAIFVNAGTQRIALGDGTAPEAKVHVDGTADEETLLVQATAAQTATNAVFNVEDSGGGREFAVMPDGDIDFSTARLETTKTECVYLDASAIVCDDAGGCSPPAQVNATNFSYTSSVFSGAADNTGYWTWQLPDNLTGTTAAVTAWYRAATITAVTADEVCLVVDGDSVAGFAAWDSATLGGTALEDDLDIDAAGGASGEIIEHVMGSFTHSMLPGERAILSLLRDVDAGATGCTGDDVGDINLVAIEFCYEVDNIFSGE